MSGNTRLAVRLVAGLAIAATLVCGVALNAWRTRAEPLPSAMRRHSRAEAVPTPVPAPPEVPPEQAQEQASWASSWMSSWNPFSSGNTAELQMVGHPVGTWRPGDPWPGGVECASGKLADAFHMKPDRGCEPNCEQCQMVCLPSAFVGPFKNHGGEIGSNCFERGCSKYVGDGSRSGVQFFMFDCDPALQKEWAETNAVMTEDEVHQKLTECLAMCKSRDQACKLTCEATHKDVRATRKAQLPPRRGRCSLRARTRQPPRFLTPRASARPCPSARAQELAEITLRMHAAAGFKGEHGDAYQTATVMGFILMCAVIAGIAGCFSIHAHHTTKDGKASKPPSKGAIAPSHTTVRRTRARHAPRPRPHVGCACSLSPSPRERCFTHARTPPPLDPTPRPLPLRSERDARAD